MSSIIFNQSNHFSGIFLLYGFGTNYIFSLTGLFRCRCFRETSETSLEKLFLVSKFICKKKDDKERNKRFEKRSLTEFR